MATNLRGRIGTTRASRRPPAPSPRRVARGRPRRRRAPSLNQTPGRARPLLNPRGRRRSRSYRRAPRTARRRPLLYGTRLAPRSRRSAPRLALKRRRPPQSIYRGGLQNEHLDRSALNEFAARRAPVGRRRAPAARRLSAARRASSTGAAAGGSPASTARLARGPPNIHSGGGGRVTASMRAGLPRNYASRV